MSVADVIALPVANPVLWAIARRHLILAVSTVPLVTRVRALGVTFPIAKPLSRAVHVVEVRLALTVTAPSAAVVTELLRIALRVADTVASVHALAGVTHAAEAVWAAFASDHAIALLSLADAGAAHIVAPTLQIEDGARAGDTMIIATEAPICRGNGRDGGWGAAVAFPIRITGGQSGAVEGISARVADGVTLAVTSPALRADVQQLGQSIIQGFFRPRGCVVLGVAVMAVEVIRRVVAEIITLPVVLPCVRAV